MAYHAQAENGALASATIGSVAVSYVTSSSANHSRERQQRDVYQAACLYLGIYRGGLLMLVLQSKSPVDYRLCNQTITVYHADKGTYTRTVHHNAFLDFHKTVTVSKDGSREANNFTLVIPGATIPVSIGDKVLIGVGAECTTREQWAALIPSKASGLVVVQSVNPKYWHGKIVHTEASG